MAVFTLQDNIIEPALKLYAEYPLLSVASCYAHHTIIIRKNFGKMPEYKSAAGRYA